MKYLFILSSLFILTFSQSCKKKSNYLLDHTKPLITIVEPVINDTLNLSLDPEVHIEFTTTDETALHTLSISVLQNGNTIFSEAPDVTNLKVYAYHEHFIPNSITSITPIKAIIKATDFGGNEEIKEVDFFVKP
ncbi:MAG: hypothetical protein KA198_07840 [Chitinophagaceae bacterium]|nr:hypothetical protein [Chitinophagaceae bacterium]